MENKDFLEEQAYLTVVEKYIDKRILQLTDKKDELRKDISNGRKAMWEDGRHGVNDFDDVVDIYLHSEVIVSNENQYVENLKELKRLEQMRENPYFARIDVEEEGYPQEAVYIGAVGLRDDKTYDMYVCDWRAPISSLFYGYDVGPARYEVDGRGVEVKLNRKRQIQIADGVLQNIYDTDSSMHDAILGNILSANTGNKLKVIISSIQKEQNTAIRKTDKQAVLIYGPAGSGKTSVGLHRLAYILYHQREKLTSENIVILSNNNIYHSYVSGILPALCEDEVSHTIFHELLRKFLPREIRVESYYSQYRMLQEAEGKSSEGDLETGSHKERQEWVKVKYSREMVEHVKAYFEHYGFELIPLCYRGHVIATKQELENKFKRNRYDSFQGRFEGLLETVRKLYEDYFEENKEVICQEIEGRINEYVSAQELEILFIKAKKRAVQEAVETLRSKNIPDAGEVLPRILETLDGTMGVRMAERLRKDLAAGHLWYEDALLYLLVRIYMGEVPAFGNVLHVLIDEAQDYHLLQLMILKLLYPRSAFTLLADVCQAISTTTAIRDYDAFSLVFGESLEHLPLLKSYRSSGPINALAFHLMEKFQPQYVQRYSYFQREGKMPQCIISEDSCKTIMHILTKLEHYNTVGIVTVDERSAYKLYQKLEAAGAEVQLITKPYDEMKGRVIIMPLILTKGLEFDVVIVEGGMRNPAHMYLACTRALHELYFVGRKGLSYELEDCEKYIEIIYE